MQSSIYACLYYFFNSIWDHLMTFLFRKKGVMPRFLRIQHNEMNDLNNVSWDKKSSWFRIKNINIYPVHPVEVIPKEANKSSMSIYWIEWTRVSYSIINLIQHVFKTCTHILRLGSSPRNTIFLYLQQIYWWLDLWYSTA